MSLPSTVTGTAFSTATCTGGYKTFPFRDNGDTTTAVYYHEMRVTTEDYACLSDDDTMTSATQKPVRSPFADDADAYYVGDQSVSNGGDGWTTFIRVFAHIPQTRYDPTGLYAFDFSGVTTTSSNTDTTTHNYTMSISSTGYNGFATSPAYAYGSSLGTGNVFIGSVSGDVSKLAVGNSFTVTVTPSLVYYQTSGAPFYGSTESKSSFAVTIKAISGTILSLSAGSFYGQDTARKLFATNPTSLGFSKTVVTDTSTSTDGQVETRNSPSRELKTYIKTNDPTSEVMANMTQLPDSLSASTTPTLDAYNQMVADGDYLNGAPETIRRYMGNIYEKSLIQVRAIN